MPRKNDKQDDIARLEMALGEMRSRERELEASRKAMLFLLEDLEANRLLIEQAKREWAAVFDAIQDPIILHDQDFRILRANLAYARLAGMAYSELLERVYWEVFPRRDGPLPGCARDVMEGGGLVEEFALPAGETYLSRSFRTLGENGGYFFSVHIFENITERKHAEQELRASEARLHRIVEQQADGLVVVDMNGVVTFLNPAAERLLGRPQDALLGSPFGHPVIGKATTEVQVARPDGSTGYAEMCAIESEWGGKQVRILSLHDITERKQFEEELQQGVARLKRVLEETIQAVALAAEKRDPYTAGHQQRVTELAVAIAREIGWEENRIEGLRLGAAIHDIGKIYVPAEILSRPGKLSPTEFEMIKSHCQVGYEIMRGVEFPWPVAEIILQHHERLDGSGYPNGLKGDEILPEAQVLMVADVVEAMASHRPYRSALSLDAALAEIAGKRGTWYEAEAVDACLRLFREKGYRLQ